MSEGFIRQAQYWGISISKGFVKEPETNGVIERFHRTFKEQIVHGRQYHSIEDFRRAVSGFIEAYNENWLLEKLRYHSPKEARRQYEEGNNVLESKITTGLLSERKNTATLFWQQNEVGISPCPLAKGRTRLLYSGE